MRTTTRALLASATAAAVIPLLALPAGATASPTASAVALAGSRAAWATPAAATGDTPEGEVLTLTLALAPRDPAGAEAAANAVSDPRSASYGQYLTPQQVKDRFAATDATVAKVTDFLTAQGVEVIETSPVNRSVRVALTAAKAEQLFGTQLKEYRHDGTTVQANDSEVVLPADIAGAVTAVQGLTDLPVTKTAPPPDAFVNSGPCSAYYGEELASDTPQVNGTTLPYAPCGYVPSQLRSAYDVQGAADSSARIDGRGTSVAVVDAYNSPTLRSDVDTYATRHGDPAFAKGQLVDLRPPTPYAYGYDDEANGDLCGEQGWYGEETLDVEAVHAMAPGARVVYSGAASCLTEDLDAAIARVVDGHLADIVSNSWGSAGEDLDPASQAARHFLFVQAALEGVGLYFSSGDSGDEVANTGVRSPDSPASDPFVTAVGGTSLAVGADGKRQFETGWSTGSSVLTDGAWTPPYPGDYLYGAGGGTSRLFVQPAYQRGVVPKKIATSNGSKRPMRTVPDVAAVGDPNTGMLIGITQSFPDPENAKKTVAKYSEYRIGGTSLASPLFAGVMALADQAAGRPHGFANYFLYDLYGSPALHDVTPEPDAANPGVVRVDFVNGLDASGGLRTTLRSFDVPTTIRTRTGYDDVTGIGTPNGSAFLLAAAAG